MPELTLRQQCDEAIVAIRQRTRRTPAIGLILGSGLSPLADAIENADIIPYGELPHWPVSTVAGHSGRLVVGELENQTVLVMQGRAHFYEGYSMAQVTFPVRVMGCMGIDTLLVTNAAGGLNAGFHAGDIMRITDHINLVGMTGLNPLLGPNDESFGPRFPDLHRAYDPALGALAHEAAAAAGMTLREGVYVYVSGPFFETPAEVRMLRALGADAVGMSTVPEVTVARHMKVRVLGLSAITNVSIDASDAEIAPSHEEVIEAGRVIVPKMTAVVRGVLRAL